MNNLNNVNYHGFPYLFLSISQEGKAMASNLLFYGPWDESLALSEIIAALKLKTNLLSLPNGATVATISTNGDLIEYYIWDNELYTKTAGILDNDIKVVFAYQLNNILDPSEIQIPSIDLAESYLDLVNKFANSSWTLTLNSNIDYTTHVLWQSYGVFKVDRKTGRYLLLNLDGTTEGSPSWSRPFMSGGGSSSSTGVADDIYRCSLSNYNVSIPKNINGHITNKALKLATYTTFLVFHNGVPVVSDISDIALQNSFYPVTDGEGNGFTLKYGSTKVLYEGSEITVRTYWLEWANTPDNLTTEERENYSKSIYDDVVLSKLIKNVGINQFFSILYVATIDGNTISIAQLLKFIDKEFSYKLLVSPNMVNIPKSNLAPAILCTANKYYWDGNTIEYIKDTDSKHYYKLSTPTAEEWSTDGGSEVAPTQDGSYMFSQEQVNGLIAGNDNYDYITAELIAEDKETREDIQSVPLFFQSLLRTELLSNFDSDIIGSSVNVGKDLVGDNGANTPALKALTEGALTISHKNIPLLPKQYRITSITDVSHTDVIEDRRSQFVLIDDDGTILDGSDESHTYDPTKYIHYPKKFYCSKLAGITSVEIAFEYIDPDDGILDIKLQDDPTKIYTGVQGLKINVLEGNEFYQLRIFPSLMRIQSNGSPILETILLIVSEVVGTTVTLLDDFSDFKLVLSLKKPGDNEFDTYSYTNINPNGIINLLNYDNKETPGDKINWLLYKDGLSYFTLLKIVNDSPIYCDLEDFDIFLMPKDGEDGESAYTLIVPSTVIFDDDSTQEGIKSASTFVPRLLYGSSEVSLDDYTIDIYVELYDEDDNIITDTVFDRLLYDLDNKYYYLQAYSTELHGDDWKPFDGKYFYGHITYIAYDSSSTIYATTTLFVKTFNYSDGLNYILNVSPNVLYKNALGFLVTEDVNTKIRFLAILSSGLNNEVLTLNNNTYIELNFDGEHEGESISPIIINSYDTGKNYAEIDFSDNDLEEACRLSSVIICNLYVNGIVLRSETILFSKQGETGESVESGYSIHLDNDNVIIDDDTSNEDLEIASETKITVTHNGQIVGLDSISDDSNLQITLSSKLEDLFVLPILSVEGDTYHLQWKENHTPVSEVSGTITVSLTFTDDLDSSVTISRKLNVIIKDFSDGSVYKLRAIPNAIVVNPDRTSNIKTIELSVDKIKDGIPDKVNLTTSGITFSVSSIQYSDNTTTYNNISLDNISYTTASTHFRKLLLIKDAWLQDPTWIGLQIYAKKSNTIIDAETISYITDGQDGNGVEYIYCRTNTIDSNIDANKLYGFVVTDGEYIVRKNNYKYDDFLPIISSTETYGDGTKVSEEDLSKFVYWTDEPSGVDSTHQYEYLATRKYNGKTKAWGAFSVPVICNKYVTPSMNLLLDNEIIIVDDNATSAILKEVSLTSFKLFNGLNDISSNVSSVTDPNKDYLLTVTEEGGSTKYFDIKSELSTIDHKLYIYLSLKDNKTLLPGQYHNIYYRVTDKNNTLVAEKVQKVKVTNFSEDGSSYKLQLSNNILYRQFNGNTLSELPDEDIAVRVQKITGDLSDVLYEKINCDESELFVCCLIKNKLGEIEKYIYDSTSNDNTTFVIPGTSFNNCNHKNSTINICLYATLRGSLLTLLDRQQITFNVVGLSGSSAITATITNDSILIDDLSSAAIIEEASGSRITLYRSSNDIILTDDYSISGSINDGQAQDDSAFNVLITLSLDKTYYESVLKLKQGKQLVQGTYTITYTISSNSNEFPTFLKYLRLKITDVTEDGSTYKLLVRPDVIESEWDNTNNCYLLNETSITIEAQKISTDGPFSIFAGPTTDMYVVILIYNTLGILEDSLHILYNDFHHGDNYDGQFIIDDYLEWNLGSNTGYLIILLYYPNDTLHQDVLIDQEVISINRPGKTGAKGDKGCSIRTFYLSGGHPKNGFTYQDGTSDFLDYIVFDGTLTQLNVYNVYKCKKSYTYTSQSPSISSDTIHWLLIDSGQDAFYQNLIALNAHVENLVATTIDSTGIELYNDLLDHTTKYGLFKAPTNNTDYPLWLGKDNEGKPKFSVDQDGNLTCNNVKSFFKGSVITNELEVTLKLLALDKNYNADDTNEVLLYINPLEYGLNVRITNGKKDGDHIQWEDVGIKDPLFPGDISLSVIYLYIDLPAYYLNGTVNHDELYNDYTSYETLELRGLPADDRSDHLSDFYSVSVPYIKYVDTFIEKQLHLSIDLTDVNVLIRGCLSSYYENNMKNIQYNTLLENAFNNLLINDFQPYYYQSGSGFDTDKPIVYPYGDIYIKDNNKMLDVMCGNLKQKYVFICKLITYENSDAVYWLSLTLLNHESLNYREYANTDPTFPIDRIKNEAFGINSNSQNNYDNITPEDINNYYYYYYEDNTANNP